MLEPNPEQDAFLIREWQEKISQANRNNIFYHCRCCANEWVGSYFDIAYCSCGSSNVEQIPCWQFPDD